jgi:WD40 repeat protein
MAYTILATSDPRRIMVSSPAGTRIWELPTRNLKWTSDPLPSSVICAAFSPDGRELAVSGAAKNTGDTPGALPFIRRLRCENGSRIGDLTIEENKGTWAHAIQYAPDSRTLFAAKGPGVTAWNLLSGHAQHYIEPGYLSSGCSRIAVSPDGKHVAASSAGDERQIVAWDIDTRRTIFRDNHRSTNGFIFGLLHRNFETVYQCWRIDLRLGSVLAESRPAKGVRYGIQRMLQRGLRRHWPKNVTDFLWEPPRNRSRYRPIHRREVVRDQDIRGIL